MTPCGIPAGCFLKKMNRYIKIFLLSLIIVVASGLAALFIFPEMRSAEDPAEGYATVSDDEFMPTVSAPVVSLETITDVSDNSASENTVSADVAEGPKPGEEGNPALTMEMRLPAPHGMGDELYVSTAGAVTGEKESYTLCFAGDVLFDPGYAIYANYQRQGSVLEKCISEDLLEIMRSEDFMMINNEFPYSERGAALEGKTYTFRAKPASVSLLGEMGVDAVSVANNHAYDFGGDAFLDTLDTLEGVQIPHVGGGRNLEEASRPLYVYAGDDKIAIIAASQIERYGTPHSKGATEDGAGILRSYPNIDPTLDAIKKAKEEGAYVILFIHWGTENETAADWAQNEQLPKFIDAGVDCVIGGHPHILQGISYVDGVPVIYSLGNFWFNSKTIDTGMVELEWADGGVKNIRFIPCRQSGCGVKLLHDSEAQALISYMQSLSPGVNIDAEGYITAK